MITPLDPTQRQPHWLTRPDGEPLLAEWIPSSVAPYHGYWQISTGAGLRWLRPGDDKIAPYTACEAVLTPAQVAAQRTEIDELAQQIAALMEEARTTRAELADAVIRAMAVAQGTG